MEVVANPFQAFAPAGQTSTRHQTVLLVVLADLLAFAVIHAAGWLLAGLNQPIADLHQFRQTQTAITAYWIWRGGPLIAYQTPVLGYPWSVPFEFPVYQYLLALLRLIGIPIAAGGRLLSFAFYLGLLWPLRMLLRNLGLGTIDFLVMAILLLTAPIYIYWSRTVMMESCALFFAAVWLAYLVQYLESRALRDAVIATIFGTLAVATKLTSFEAFGLLGGIAFLHSCFRINRSGFDRTALRFMVRGALAGIIPVAIGAVWVLYSDHLKMANLLGTQLTSSALATWNFGTIEQRLSPQFWLGAISNRMLPDILGFSAIPALIAAGAALSSGRYARLLGLAALGFLVPMLTFTNLHFEHNYYQYANAVFLLAVVGFGLARIIELGRPALSVTLLFVVVAGQLLYFYIGFARVITADYSGSRQVVVGALADQVTTPEQSLLIIGDDWSSAIAFDSARKAITLPYSATSESIQSILAQPDRYAGDAPLGAVVYCPDQVANYRNNQNVIRDFVAQRKVLGTAAGCQLLAPGRR